jgi:hypothetical protein
MGEIKFALKCLAATALLIMLSQVKVGNSSIEDYAQNWLRSSKVAQFVQNAARGGARLIQDGFQMGTKMISKSEVPAMDSQRASRFNFEIKRSMSSTRPVESEKHLPKQNSNIENLDEENY